MKKAYKKISTIVEKFILTAGGIALVFFLLIVFSQIILRNFFKMPLIWANDVSLILFIWSVFLGAACAVKYRKHYMVDVIPHRYEKANAFFDIVADIAGFFFFYVLIKHGYTYTIMSFSRISTSVSIPQAYFFMVIPISGVAMFMFNIENLVNDVEKFAALLKGKSVNKEGAIE